MTLSIWSVLFVLLPLLGGLAAICCALANRFQQNKSLGVPPTSLRLTRHLFSRQRIQLKPRVHI